MDNKEHGEYLLKFLDMHKMSELKDFLKDFKVYGKDLGADNLAEVLKKEFKLGEGDIKSYMNKDDVGNKLEDYKSKVNELLLADKIVKKRWWKWRTGTKFPLDKNFVIV